MKIQIPTNCPSCDSELELVNAQLFCNNSSCPAKSSKKVEAYAKVMKIKGLGPKTIEKLCIEEISDLYFLDKDYYIEVIGEKLGEKLYNEIERSKNTTLDVFLAALSIPLIGTTAAKKISKVTSSLEGLTEENLLKAGLGEKARFNILQWMENEYIKYKDMPINLAKQEEPNITEHKGMVCITGKLIDYKNRTDAAIYLESLGFTVTSGVSQKTDFLVDEEGKTSSKRKKAEQLGIKIVTIKQLEDI
jgi:DNA ligase (NAD+)